MGLLHRPISDGGSGLLPWSTPHAHSGDHVLGQVGGGLQRGEVGLHEHGVQHLAGETELREELEDGIEYKLSAEGKLRIEEKRIYFLARG